LLVDSEQFGLDCVKNGITDFRLFLKMLSENDEVHLILKNSRQSARTIKREQERIRTQQILYWFTQQQGYVQSLTHSKDFTKLINLIQFTTLAYNKMTLHSAANPC